MKNKLLFILTSPLFISLILTVILLIALPPLFSKYKIDFIKKEKNHSLSDIQYCDLNNDGYSEKISTFKGYNNITNILVSEKGKIINQWNFNGNLSTSKVFFGDFNDDGLKEVFLFTISENKILLNCFNPFENKNYIKDKFIDNFFQKNGESGCKMPDYFLTDLTNDQIKELIFSFSAGYSISPRKVYYYNFATDSLYKSPESCIVIRKLKLIKKSENKSPIFIISTSAVGNCDSNTANTDYFSWLVVFNKDLDFKFEPIKIGYYPSDLYVLPYIIDNETFLIVLNIYQGKKNYPCSISLYDLMGNKIKEKEFNFTNDWETARLLSKDNNYNKIYLVKNNGGIEEISKNLEFREKQKIFETLPQHFTEIDIDSDNKNEFIFHHRNQEKITILRNDLSNPLIIDVPGNNNLKYASIILSGTNPSQLFLSLDKYSYYFNYYKNPLYNYNFLFYGLIYLGVFSLLFLLQKAQKYRLEQKYKVEKKIAELQIKSIKNQTDPHFTLNIINSIGSLFAKRETEKANYVFGKYSKLLRSTILSSDQILTTLNNEIEYVENYLSLEQFRFKDGFDFKIEKDENVNGNIKIPKMLIHTFVENAIKHGIKHLEEKGQLFISVLDKKNNYVISIRDNGIGRKKAKEINSFGTGKGLEIMNQILDLYYTLEKVRVTYEIKDLTNEKNEALGTEVLIKIPILNS